MGLSCINRMQPDLLRNVLCKCGRLEFVLDVVKRGRNFFIPTGTRIKQDSFIQWYLFCNITERSFCVTWPFQTLLCISSLILFILNFSSSVKTWNLGPGLRRCPLILMPSLSLQEPYQFTANFSSLGWHVSILLMFTFLSEACSCVVLGYLMPFPAILLEAY